MHSSESMNLSLPCSGSLPVFFGVSGLLSFAAFSGLLIKEFIGKNSSWIVSDRNMGVMTIDLIGAIGVEFALIGAKDFLFSFSKSFSWRPRPGM
jgi:hypothetical protein